MTKTRIPIIRAILGFSQKEFADLIGVSLSTISLWENEECFITGKHLEILSDCGINTNFIVSDNDYNVIKLGTSFEAVKQAAKAKINKV